MAREGTVPVSLEPVPRVSFALCKGGGLADCLMELYVQEWPGPASRIVKEVINCICFECWSMFMGKGPQINGDC